MRKVYDAFPEDNDICALHAEALMTRTPWALWDLRSGEPSRRRVDAGSHRRAGNRDAASRDKPMPTPHAGMLHMYIHVMEMSPMPEKALRACDALRTWSPMPRTCATCPRTSTCAAGTTTKR